MIADDTVLPGPLAVGAQMVDLTLHGDLLFHLWATLWRVVAAFALAMGIGAALGIVLGRQRRVDQWLDLWVVVFLNIPALVTIVLCYLWIGLTEVAAITAVALNKIPMVTVILREGARALNPALDDMAQVYRMPWRDRFRHVVLPQLAPFFASAARTGVALIWKIVLVVEFLGRSSGIGFKIHLNFQLFDIAAVLAYASAFVLVMLAVEFAVLKPLESRANRWRQS